MQAPWTEEEAALLKHLREQALLTPAAFAKRHALSNGQLRELEQGGKGSFYSEDIKAYNGRKLLKALGYIVPVQPEPAPEPPAPAPVAQARSFESEPEPPPPLPAAVDDPVSATEEAAQAPVLQENTTPSPAATDPESGAPSVPGAGEAHARDHEPEAEPQDTRARSGNGAWLLAALALAAAVGVLWVTSDQRRPAPAAAPSAQPGAEPALPAASNPEAAPAGAPQPAAPTTSSAASAQAKAVPVAWPAGCEPVAGSPSTSYQSPVADRPDTYVHVESLQDARVCVVDAQNRPTMLSLQPGQSNTVYGTAPFVIRSSQWQHLKVYFQGLRVQVDAGQPTEQVVIHPRRGA